ncbi:alpha/beta fold hydrolase [Saccharospirillum salsuginis]|uniref:Alpha/beta hydrolase n=1 Tax=Saccharospirillum salsuginis TaxID=418750 RepID=A0A918KTQ5_9GAMM|nr:alpha/beta fold hydrolase [Saccharospirillum salsuginis]GGX75612.1 alpha/beta hydrolase [Saccharospirillum salsuginis]
MKQQIHEERLKVPTVQGGHLFVRQLAPENPQGIVLLVHGLGNRGDLFLHEGHGLANFLSEMGFACLVPDLIGHGQSWPKRSRRMTHGIEDIVTEDLPRLATEARRLAKGKPVFLIGQGFGGVLLASAYTRIPAMRPDVAGMVHFGTRRSAKLGGVAHSPTLAVLRRRILPFIGQIKGEIPLNWLRQSLDAETITLYREYLDWSESDWVGRNEDALFDYTTAAQSLDWPASLYFARRNGGYDDHPADVREFMREIGTHNARLMVLGKRDGNLRNYSPLSMLQHDDAWVDHFPVVLDWMTERVRQIEPEGKVRHLVSV